MVVVAPLLFKTLIRGNYQAIALWPFIVLKCKERRHDKVLINHERIHLRQQLECLILPFNFKGSVAIDSNAETVNAEVPKVLRTFLLERFGFIIFGLYKK